MDARSGEEDKEWSVVTYRDRDRVAVSIRLGVYVYIYKRVCMLVACIYMFVAHVCIDGLYMHSRVCVHVRRRVCVYISTCMYVCTYVFMARACIHGMHMCLYAFV